jgi:hypothetical protein
MLTEAVNVKQSGGDIRRRWFSDEYFDLILWEDENKDILRFELCYGKNKDEHAFIWSRQSGNSHLKVDDGEDVSGSFKMSPIMIADGHVDPESILAKFLEASRMIDQKISHFVYSKLKDKNKIMYTDNNQ